MDSREMYNITRQMGRTAAKLRQMELLQKAMQTGNMEEFMQSQIQAQMRKRVRKSVNKIARNMLKG